MSIKWTMEAVWACAAVLVTVGGGFYQHVYGAGATNTAVQQLTTHQGDQDKRLDNHEKRLTDAAVSASAQQQALADIKDQLNRMEDNQHRVESKIDKRH